MHPLESHKCIFMLKHLFLVNILFENYPSFEEENDTTLDIKRPKGEGVEWSGLIWITTGSNKVTISLSTLAVTEQVGVVVTSETYTWDTSTAWVLWCSGNISNIRNPWVFVVFLSSSRQLPLQYLN